MPRRSPTAWLAWLYLCLALVGGAWTWSYNVQAFLELGSAFTPAAFVQAGFEGSPILGSLAADFWLGSSASLIWMVVEARRLGMRWIWAYVVLTFVIAWAFALPLFLAARERHLARAHGAPGQLDPASPEADPAQGRGRRCPGVRRGGGLCGAGMGSLDEAAQPRRRAARADLAEPGLDG
ncbi:MAG TPA: DUF2834 domain-containing protein [Deltaproteobacteria bacterium]|nr:DUF2834 domain-containing protein [Deltaproteobacteria bacterium]